MGASCSRKEQINTCAASQIIYNQIPYDPNLKIEDQGMKNVLNDLQNLITHLQNLQADVLKVPSKINEIQIQ